MPVVLLLLGDLLVVEQAESGTGSILTWSR